MTKVEGTPRNFSYSLPVTVDKQHFWAVWTDVSTWPEWDTPLAEATLHGEFTAGTVGKLRTKSGQQSTFTLTHVSQNESYTFETKLPGARLVVSRYFSEKDNDLTFVHNVRFEGRLGLVFAQLLGRGFMRELPPVMKRLVYVAEGNVKL